MQRGLGSGGWGVCFHFVSSLLRKRRKQKMFGNNERKFVFCCQLNSQRQYKDRCWFHYSKKVVTIAFLSSFSVDCQCFLRRFSPSFRAILQKPPVVLYYLVATAQGCWDVVWTLKELNINLHVALSFFGSLSTEFIHEMRFAHCSVYVFFLGSARVP